MVSVGQVNERPILKVGNWSAIAVVVAIIGGFVTFFLQQDRNMTELTVKLDAVIEANRIAAQQQHLTNMRLERQIEQLMAALNSRSNR